MALFPLFLALLAGFRWPGVLLAGALMTFDAESLMDKGWITLAYVVSACVIAVFNVSRSPAKPARINKLDAAFLVFVGLYCCTATYAPDPEEGFAEATKVALSAGSMFLLGRLTVNPQQLRKPVAEFIAGMVLLGAVYSVLLLGPRQHEVLRLAEAGTTYGSPVGLSAPYPIAILSALTGVFFAFNAKRWVLAAASAGAAGFFVYMAVMSATRGVFVSLAIALLAIAFFALPRVRIERMAIPFAAIAALAVGFAPKLFHDRGVVDQITRLTMNFGGGGDVLLDESSRGRFFLQSQASELFNQHLLFGDGIGGYATETGLYYPHNLFMEIAANFGLVGLALLCVWLALTLYNALRLATIDAVGIPLFGFLVASFVHAQLSFSFFMLKPLFLVTGILAGSGVVAYRHRREPTLVSKPALGG